MIYIDGFAVPITAGTTREAYAAFAEAMGRIVLEHGATRVVEAWGDDVPAGQVTDFRRAVAAEEGETVAFSWIEWPSRAARDDGMRKVMDDPRMQPGAQPTPFDGRRMIFGGFQALIDLKWGEKDASGPHGSATR